MIKKSTIKNCILHIYKCVYTQHAFASLIWILLWVKVTMPQQATLRKGNLFLVQWKWKKEEGNMSIVQRQTQYMIIQDACGMSESH